MSGQIVGARQMVERSGDLVGTVFVNLITIEIGDDDAMHRGRGIEESVALDVECQPQSGMFLAVRHDESRGQIGELGHSQSRERGRRSE